MTADCRRVDTKEVAVLIRKRLRREFPGVKFSVRISRYSMGSSISVSWADGPTKAQVEKITGEYSGSRFDGMIDLKYYVRHWLMPDGSTVVACSPGTSDSRGSHEPESNPKPCARAELVQFGSDGTNASRTYSDGLRIKVQPAIEKAAESEDIPKCPTWAHDVAIHILKDVDATRPVNCLRKRSGWGIDNLDHWSQVRLIAGCFEVEYEEAPAPAEGDGYRIEKHVHTKKGFDMWIVIHSFRMERGEYLRVLDIAKAAGGWYSRKWGKTPAGFAFKDEGAAIEFANSCEATPESRGSSGETGSPSKTKPRFNVDKLRAMADRMESQATDKLAPRSTHTPKKMAQAASARVDGNRLNRAAAYIRALCDAVDAGTLPDVLHDFKATKASFLEVAHQQMAHVPNGYHSYHVEKPGEWAWTGPDAVALRKLAETPDHAERELQARRDADLQRSIDELRFVKVPGFFPTPPDLAAEVVREAQIESSHRVLEPSAGIGSLAEACPNPGNVDCVETWASLQGILDKKQFAVIAGDFLEQDPSPIYDRVVMNPPFEKGAAAKHVQHAYEFLADGGRLVAIVPNGPQFQKMEDWVDDVGGWSRQLPADSFKGVDSFRQTGVHTRLLVIDK